MLVFFSQHIDVYNVIDSILNLKGSDVTSKHEITVNLLIDDGYDNLAMLQEAVEALNRMFLRDEQGRLVKVSLILPGRG